MAKKEKQTPATLYAKLERMWNEASSDRVDQDWRWFVYDMWVKGNQDARYDTKTKRVIGTAPKDGRPKISINKIYPTLRNVRNYALRNRPKAEVTPETLNDDSLRESMNASKYLDYIHDTQHIQRKLKGTLWSALKYSVAWWQVVWNGEEIEINRADTFDCYPDPKARNTDELRYFILAVRRNIEDLKNDPKYDKFEVEQVKPDNKQSSSSYKEMELTYENSGNMNQSKETATVIVKEIWYKEDKKVMVSAIAGGRTIRKPEEVNSKIIPFFKLASDINDVSMYGEGWVKHMINPQKVLNSAVQSLVEYNLIMNKINYVVDKGSGIRIIRNEHGQIIEKKRGYDVSTMPIAPINSALYQQMDYASLFLEDIGAMHDASKGRMPNSATSGRAIEALQIGDSNNMSELVENIEDFLEEVYGYVLWLASQNYMELKPIAPKDYSGSREYLKVIGEASPVAQQMIQGGQVPDQTIIIPEKNIVDVKITSYLAHTPEAKRESVKELFSIIPNLPEDVILDAYGVGNIAEVVEKIKIKRAEEMQMAAEQEKQTMQNQQDVQNPAQGAQEAIASIRTLIQGGTPQVPTNPGQDYLQAMDQFIEQEGQMGELEPQILQAVQTFRDQVAQGTARQ